MRSRPDAARFRDEGRYEADFLDEVRVLCPACGAPGVVVATLPYWSSTPRFTCRGCALRLEGRYTRWFGPCQGAAGRRCARCGRPLSRRVDGRPEVVRKVDLACGCGAQTSAPVTWSFDVSGLPYDPSFGLALELQTRCAGQPLHVYNGRHLRFLADYVAAGLRERTTRRNASLASRLPKWMKAAKNRDAVRAALDRLAVQAR